MLRSLTSESDYLPQSLILYIRKTLGIELGGLFYLQSILTWCYALMLLKKSGEMTRRRKTELIANVDEAFFVTGKRIEGKLHLENVCKNNGR